MSKSCNKNWMNKRQNGSLERRNGRKRYSKWLLRRQRPRCLGPDSTLYIRCPHPSPHPWARSPIPLRPGNFLFCTTLPSSIYSTIHLSFHLQMEIITQNNTTTNGLLSILSSTSHPNLSFSGWRVFWSDLLIHSQWEKEIRLNHAKNVTGRFWCGLVILSAREYHAVQANSRDACAEARIWCRRQSWFYITLDYSDTLRQLANSQ